MLKVLIIFFILNIYSQVFSSTKEQVISKLEKTQSLSFNFEQTIGKKNEKGSCTIKYPKKIYCAYNGINKKIMVSNGKSLVIKNKNTGAYYFYPLKKTPLEFLLDKNFLIKKMNYLSPRNINNKYLNFRIIEKNNEINIFFDIKTFNLVGWQTEDIYQNLTITYISSVKINQNINENIFILPKKD